MKKLFFAVIASAGFAIAGHPQTKPVLTSVIKTPNALCENCKTRIEAYLKRYDGILEVTVNFRKGDTKVKFVTDRINIEEIKTAIANCGYDADDVPAAEDAYNRLPKTCKKFEDGGGHPKPKTPPPPPQQ
ncbi:MAG TPA: heavy-metal-associated domain-containing protein [Chitinophagaceae bacterium]|nr:heavy-metal-associated domain-containing protein [Chitinophagaceae bacterium]